MRIPVIDDHKELKPLIRHLMVNNLHKDPESCEMCGCRYKALIHHPRYEGATLYDLMFICARCNNNKANKGLT